MLITMLNLRLCLIKVQEIQNIYDLNLVNSPFHVVVALNLVNPRSWLLDIHTKIVINLIKSSFHLLTHLNIIHIMN
jgi:hypothetical protein